MFSILGGRTRFWSTAAQFDTGTMERADQIQNLPYLHNMIPHPKDTPAAKRHPADYDRLNDVNYGTNSYCKTKMKEIQAQFVGKKMMSMPATCQFQAWRNIKLQAVHDEAITINNIDQYHRIEVAELTPGTNYLVGHGYSNITKFGRKLGVQEYVEGNKRDLELNHGGALSRVTHLRAWDKVRNKFPGGMGISVPDLDMHFEIELAKMRLSSRKRGKPSTSMERRRINELEESEEIGGSGQPPTKKVQNFENTRPASMQKENTGTARTSARLNDKVQAELQEALPQISASSDSGNDADGAVNPQDFEKAKGNRSSLQHRYTPEKLAWANEWFRKNASDTKKKKYEKDGKTWKWFEQASLEFQEKFDQETPKLHKPNTGLRNIHQAMKKSGQLEGEQGDVQFYEKQENYPRKEGSINWVKQQQSLNDQKNAEATGTSGSVNASGGPDPAEEEDEHTVRAEPRKKRKGVEAEAIHQSPKWQRRV